MEQKLYDVAIIGGGPGGYTAGLYCARSGFSVVVLEKLSPGGQMATTGQVDNYPGFEGGVDGFELGEKMQRGAERFGVETRFAEVTGVELAAVPKVIQTSEGEVRARAVVLATGASPREMGLPGEQELRGRGVAYCATCDGMMYRNKTVAVPVQAVQRGLSDSSPGYPAGLEGVHGRVEGQRYPDPVEQPGSGAPAG